MSQLTCPDDIHNDNLPSMSEKSVVYHKRFSAHHYASSSCSVILVIP